MPRIMKRPGTFGFSSTFIFATVARPLYSVAIASTAGARRRHGPHHSAQKSTSVTPFLISSSKLLSVNIFTFSAAILVSMNAVQIGGAGLIDLPYNPGGTRIYFDVLTGGCVPGKVLLHSGELNPLPCTPITINSERPDQCVEQRLS